MMLFWIHFLGSPFPEPFPGPDFRADSPASGK